MLVGGIEPRVVVLLVEEYWYTVVDRLHERIGRGGNNRAGFQDAFWSSHLSHSPTMAISD